MVFLSETQIYECDFSLFTSYLEGYYCHSLSSQDTIDPEIPLLYKKARGGTMIFWEKSLDPYISVLKSPSSAMCGIVMEFPDIRTSAHFSIYLPTSGLDSEFLNEISNLQIFIEQTLELYPGIAIFIRGDSNSNPNNNIRTTLFQGLLDNLNLKKLKIPHMTYHHFLGGGKFDSNIDIIAQPSNNRDVF